MVEDHHYCRGLDTQTVAVHTTDGNGAGVFFVLKRKKKEREKKSLIKSRYFSPLRDGDPLEERFLLLACAFAFNSYLFIRTAF